MVFAGVIFLIFFLPLVLFVYYGILKERKKRNCFLFLASLFFYAWGEPKFVCIMIISILLNYRIGLQIERRQTFPQKYKRWLIIGIGINLSSLFIFKYLGFLVENINLFLSTQFSVPEISLPIGISFFTFQSLSYLVDIFREEVPA